MLWHIELKFAYNLLYCTTDQVRVSSICVNFCRSDAPFWNYNTGNTQVSSLFSYMLSHIELTFCIWLCFTVLQIIFECRQSASMFVGVMPLLELRILEIYSFPQISLHALTYWTEILYMNLLYCITDQVRVSSIGIIFVEVIPLLEIIKLEIHNFPHFFPSCFHVLSWNYAYDFILLYYKLSSSVVNLRLFLKELCPFWNLEYWKYTVFRTFLFHILTHWAEILHMTLFYCTTDQVRV